MNIILKLLTILFTIDEIAKLLFYSQIKHLFQLRKHLFLLRKQLLLSLKKILIKNFKHSHLLSLLKNENVFERSLRYHNFIILIIESSHMQIVYPFDLHIKDFQS